MSRARARCFGLVLVACALVLVQRVALAQQAPPLKTWGGSSGTSGDSVPQAAPTASPANSTEANSGGSDIAPPPSTIGTPIDSGAENSNSAPQPKVEAPPESEAIVHAPGHVGLRYALEGIEVRGNTTTLARVVLRYVPFHSGDTIDVDDKELTLTRFRLLGTGFFRDVQLSLRRGTRRGNVVLVINVVERNTIVVNDLWLGLSSDAEPNGSTRPLTAYGGIDVAETNLAGTGITLGGAVALADRQLGLRTRFLDPQFLGSKWQLEAQLLYNHARDFFGNQDVLVDDPTQQVTQDYAVVTYDRFGGMLGVGHDLGVSTQVFFDYRLEAIDAQVPLAASHRRGLDIVPIDFYINPGSSILSTVRGTLLYDTRDDPFLPTRGVQLSLLADASLTPLGSDYPYTKLQLHMSNWTELPWGHVLKLEGFGGAIFGNAPMFEKFYIGDFSDLLPDRVLDLTFDRRAAPNFLGTDIVEIRYGDYAAKVNVEYRIPLYRGHRTVYGADFFTSAGLYGVANEEDIVDHARGYSGFATVPVDFTFNTGLRIETSAGGFVFGVSNFLGFLPIRSNARPQ
jgi:outer membrane protein assembly factor BamA